MSRLRVLGHYLRARRRSFADRAALERHQRALLTGVLRRAPARYGYYARLFPAAPPARLAELPILDKAEVIAEFAGLNVRGVELSACRDAARAAERGRDFSTSLRGLSVGLSSGTSGQQTAFLTSPAERDRWAGEVLARALPRGLIAGARITLVLRAGGPLYESVGSRRVAFTFVDLALPSAELAARVWASRPTILVAPPSVLATLATELPSEAAAVERVFSVAEVLEPHDGERLARSFGLRIDQVYQAAEGFLGMSCRLGTLHLAEDLVLVEREPVPGATDGRFVPVVTDLVRSSQAVLRRRLGDVLVPGACACGDPRLAIAQIVGRSDDVLELPRLDGAGRGLFFPDFVRAAVLAVPGVADFRVLQRTDDTLEVSVLPPERGEDAAAALLAALTGAGLAPAEVRCVPMPPRDPSNKLRRVRREA